MYLVWSYRMASATRLNKLIYGWSQIFVSCNTRGSFSLLAQAHNDPFLLDSPVRIGSYAGRTIDHIHRSSGEGAGSAVYAFSASGSDKCYCGQGGASEIFIDAIDVCCVTSKGIFEGTPLATQQVAQFCTRRAFMPMR